MLINIICTIHGYLCISIDHSFLYISFVSNGLSTSSSGTHIGGTILSLAPPILALLVTVYAKKEPFYKFFMGQNHSPQNDEQDTYHVTIQNQDSEDTTLEGEEEPLLVNAVNTHQQRNMAPQSPPTLKHSRFTG